MPAITASAPGKVILFGEHAVVYGRPAIAVPVREVRAKAVITANPAAPAGQVQIAAENIGIKSTLEALPEDHPLRLTIRAVMEMLHVDHLPAMRLQVSSTIPIASGLGSGSAVSAAIARALATFLGYPLENDQVSHIAYQMDQKYHGTPSGIDNTVIAYAQPVFFIRGKAFDRLCVAQPFTLVIGNTGIPSPTGEVVGDVRRHWQADPQRYETWFDQIGAIAHQARALIEQGPVAQLGPLMTANHRLLQQLDVSCPAQDRLVEAALAAGAGGAKLCGGGRGGNMVALAAPENASVVAQALQEAGATHTIITTVQP